ncbi:NYN domain-containing protein [Rhizobium leguminosarum]|uniref:NYN domain-containing protein n=1 Tax=Rhizobium leguminosarum TaxID=384 RepID=UPI00391F9574
MPKRRGKRLRHYADDPCDGLLHSGSLDSFCLPSSDSDFTRFAARIREQGVDVFTCGEQKTGREFPTGLPAFHLHRERSSPGETMDEQSPAPADNSLQPATVTVPFIKGAVTREHRRPT